MKSAADIAASAAALLADTRRRIAEIEAAGAPPFREIDTPLTRRWRQSQELLAAVKRRSLDGALVREIAAELGINYDRVVRLRAEAGVGRGRDRSPREPA